jgi:hypothetical protein
MRLKPEVLKVGDKVRNKVSGDQGTVIIARVPHTEDCALVRFDMPLGCLAAPVPPAGSFSMVH